MAGGTRTSGGGLGLVDFRPLTDDEKSSGVVGTFVPKLIISHLSDDEKAALNSITLRREMEFLQSSSEDDTADEAFYRACLEEEHGTY